MGLDPLPPVTTVSLLVAQFIASQRPFMEFDNVPIADDDFLEMPAPDLPLN